MGEETGSVAEALWILLRFTLQALLLFYPAWRLAGREVLATPLYLVLVLYASALVCLLLNRYDWPTAAIAPAALVCLLLARDFVRRRRGPAQPATGAKISRHQHFPLLQQPSTRFLLAAAIALGISGLIMNLRAPLSGWDAMTYHIDFPLQWIEAARLQWGRTDFGDLSPPYYPALPQLWFGWWLLPGSGMILAGDATGVFWWLVLWLSLREILYMLTGATEPAALTEHKTFTEPRTLIETAALAIAAGPYFTAGLLTAENDLMLAAFFALSLYHLLRIKNEGAHFGNILRTGLAAGGLVAVKYTGLVYLAVLLFVFVPGLVLYRRAQKNSPKFDVRHLLPAIGIGIAAFGLAGGWWYLRNWIVTGNPVYPGQVRLPGMSLELFAGYYTREFFTTHPFHVYTAYEFLTDPGTAPLFWSTLALSLWRPSMARMKLLALPALLILAFYVLIPLRLPRLLAPLSIALAPAFFVGLRALPANSRRVLIPGLILALGLLLFILRLSELYAHPLAIQLSLTDFTRATVRGGIERPQSLLYFAVYFVALYCLASGALYLGQKFALKKTADRIVAVPVIATIFVVFIAGTTVLLSGQTFAAYTERAGTFGRAWNYWHAEQSRREQPLRLGVIGTNAISAFRGPGGDRPVGILNARPEADRALHSRSYAYQSARTPARPGPQRETLFREIERLDLQAVVVFREDNGTGNWPAERRWLQAAGWNRVRQNAAFEFYELQP